MKKIIVASANPVKVAAVKNGFLKMFPDQEFSVEGHSAPSEVSDQPITNQETFVGATNRAKNAKTLFPDADFRVGVEGGLEKVNGEREAFARIVVQSTSNISGKARSATFFLPPVIGNLIDQGKELGETDDIVFGQTNSKQQNGAVGILTGNIIDRAKYYEEAVVLALIPFKNSNLY